MRPAARTTTVIGFDDTLAVLSCLDNDHPAHRAVTTDDTHHTDTITLGEAKIVIFDHLGLDL